MKKLFSALILSSLAFSSSADDFKSAADGFAVVRMANVKVIDHVFHYCQRASANQNECYDVMIDSFGNTKGDAVLSTWRTADEYIKHYTSPDFSYIGLSRDGANITLYYKKVR